MQRLPHREFDKLSAFLLDLHQFRDHETFVEQTLQALHRLIPCERVTYNEMDIEKQTAYAKSTPDDPRIRRLNPLFTALMHQHPSVRHLQEDRTRERDAIRISDSLTDRQFQELPLYRDYFKYLDTTHQLAVSIDSFFINIALNRHKHDFSDEERAMLTWLRPHLALAHRNAGKASQVMKNLSGLMATGTATGMAAVRVDRQGRIVWMTDNADHLLRTYCHTASAEHLPPLIRKWFRLQTAAWVQHSAHLTSSQPLTLPHDQGTLTVSLLRDTQDEIDWWVLFQEHRESVDRGELQEAGLTAREAEVLQWVAQGKTNGETAIILGTSPATIKKHLERIYVKLRVETRTAAVAHLNGRRSHN